MESTILIIEDSATQRIKSERMLQNAGYKTLSTDVGEKGITLAHENDVDLVICDNNLPTIQGWEVCKLFKEDTKLKSLPIIIFTYLEEKEELLKAINAGADDYLLKNMDDEVILSKIYALLRTALIQKENIKLAQYKAIHAMIVTLSHEFNNNVNILTGNIELLKDKFKNNNQEYLDYLNAITSSSYRISKLVSRLTEITEVKFSNYTEGVDLIDIYDNK